MPPQISTEPCYAKFHENLLSGFQVFICGQTNRQIAKLVKCSFANLRYENPKTIALKIFVAIFVLSYHILRSIPQWFLVYLSIHTDLV